MKAELAPKHAQRVGNNYVLWFESPNSYIVISASSYGYLKAYLEAENQESFLHYSHNDPSVTQQDLIAICQEFSFFLEEIHTVIPITEPENKALPIPEPQIIKNYGFGAQGITIHYSSDKVLQLIHPHLQHGVIEQKPEKGAIFDIFVDNSTLYLFKNRSFIGSYDTKQFHFLQGKFAMQLLDALYGTTETDWMATFHASTICNEQEAIMVVGASGSGKSTLSALLMAHGWDLLADDFTPMLAADQHLYRFPAAISIKKGAFAIIDPLFDDFNTLIPQLNLSKQLQVKYVPPSKPFKTAQKHFECHKIVLVNYTEDDRAELKEIPSEKILEILIPDTWISPKTDHSKLFLAWLGKVKFYELTYKDNEFAIAKFDELFKL